MNTKFLLSLLVAFASLALSGAFKVRVQDRLSGKGTEVELEPSDTIENAKVKIIATKKLPAKFGIDMKILFNGKKLENGRTLADYKVGPGAIWNVYVHLRPG